MKPFQGANSPCVFISYAKEDKTLAQQLAYDLKCDEVNFWIDFNNLKPGISVPAQINEALKSCDTLVLIWSKHAANAYYVEREYNAAFHLQRRIIPYILDDTELPPLLNDIYYIAFKDYPVDYLKLRMELSVKPKGGNSSVST